MKIEWTSGVVCALAMTLGGCLFLATPGTSPGGPEEEADMSVGPCQGVTCSDAGVCVELEGGAYECVCDPGFSPAGDGCISGPSCESMTCPGGQTCVMFGDVPECVCPEDLALNAGGECVSRCEVPGLNPCEDGESCHQIGSELECLRPAETCEGLRNDRLADSDGTYTLYFERNPEQPWEVYCYDMEGTPREYLTLPATGGANNRFEEHTYNRQTSYERVRIDPISLQIDAQDDEFATTTTLLGRGGRPERSYDGNIFFGTAGSCGRGVENGDPQGRGTIDLTGTPFSVVTEFEVGGECASGRAEFMASRQIVTLRASGSCGFMAPQDNALAEGNRCPEDPNLDRPPQGPDVNTWRIELRYNADLLTP